MSLLIVLAALTPPPAPHDGAAGSSGRSLAGSRSRRALTTSADIPMPTEKRPAMSNDQVLTREIAERPEGYQGPNLSPVGLKLGAHRFTDGVYALMANIPPKDNNGIIAGREAALVVDAGITPDVSAQMQELAGQLTDRPVRYLANTTYHGDHTFGNMEFPAEVVIISSRVNKDNMTDLGYEKRIRSGNMYGDEGLLD